MSFKAVLVLFATLWLGQAFGVIQSLALASLLDSGGKPKQASSPKQLEELFTTSTHSEDRSIAAYRLVMLAETKGSLARENAFQYLVSHSEAETVLGSEPWFAVVRGYADELYQRRDFSAASRMYSILQERARGASSEYGGFRLGFCKFNQKQFDLAFSTWLGTVDWQLKRPEFNESQSRLNALGMAFAENNKRTSKDIGQLSELKLNTEQLEALLQGIAEGASHLSSSVELPRLIAQSRAFPWASDLARAVFSVNAPNSSVSCAKLSWLSLVPNRIAFHPFSRETRACLLGIEKREVVDSDFRSVIDQELPRFSLIGAQRSLRMTDRLNQGRTLAVCLEGLAWLTDPVSEAERRAANLDLIRKNCSDAIDEGGSQAVEKVISSFEPSSLERKRCLSSDSDPLLQVATTLMEKGSFRRELVRRASSDVPGYRDTRLQVKLLERTLVERETTTAFALLREFHPYDVPSVFTSTDAQLWAAFLILDEDKKTSPAEVVEATMSLLEKKEALSDTRLASLLFQLAERNQLWQSAWTGLGKNPSLAPKARDSLYFNFFSAMAEGRFYPVEESSNPELMSLQRLAKFARLGNLGEVLATSLTRPESVSNDLDFLRDLFLRQTALIARGQKEGAFGRYVDSLGAGFRGFAKKVEQRAWSHGLLQKTGGLVVGTFCQKAREQLELRMRGAMTASAFFSAASTCRAQLSACEKRFGTPPPVTESLAR